MKARRRVPVSTSLSIFLCVRRRSERLCQSGGRWHDDGRSSQLLADEIAGNNVRDVEEVAGARGIALEVVDLPGTTAKRKQAAQVSMLAVGFFDGAATGVEEGFREVTSLELDAVDVGHLLGAGFGWRLLRYWSHGRLGRKM
ncbi:hypothetical protein ACFX2J_027490 [Malus domestica]